ncbi:MAG: class I tRNA ligase family protein [Candidatus Dojkabacteria bacterium]
MSIFKKVDPKQNFPKQEDEITGFWKKNRIFEKSVEQRDKSDKYVFYDGPPFITGSPHYGSLLPSIAKDVVPRYQTMNGKRVERVWGWDCHGMPIETKVEAELGIDNRRDIEKLGIQKFIDQCYSYTRHTSAEWKWYIDKIGRWVDFDNSYKTMDQDYMESVMWVFKQLYDKKMIYEGVRTSLFDTKLGTPISNFEIAMDNSYENVEDPAVTIKFPVTSSGKFKGVFILAWTTTPWTLPANKALVVDPEEDYLVIEVAGEKLILAHKRAEYVLEGVEHKVLETFKGKELVGLKYEPPFTFYKSEAKDHKVYSYSGMVHMEEGTGIVHSAPGFGDIDTEMGKELGLSVELEMLDDMGKYTDVVSAYKGMYVKEADDKIIEDLKAAGRLLKVEKITHRYPIGPRSGVRLIHKAQHSWFIDVQGLKPGLVDNNEKINWVPDHLKEGRFKKGIQAAPDWGISRSRFWSTPLPVWQLKKNGEVVEREVIGSRDELRAKSIQPITKVTFVRHGQYDHTDDDQELNDTGWRTAEELKKDLSSEKFDGIYSSEHTRAVQTVDDIAIANNSKVVTLPGLGSIEQRRKSDEIEKKILSSQKVSHYADAPEEVLAKEYAGILKDVKTGLDEMLAANKGKYLLVATHEEEIAFIKHLAEGTRLKEALAASTEYGATVTMYFHGTELLNLHRPKIDAITLKGKKGDLTRVPEVLDVWMDSGSMPYASKHYPFENKAEFEANYPADFIVEYIGQTRAWFYVMHVLSGALMNKPSFRNVVTTGVIFGTDGRKMSKSYGNYPDPRGVIEKYGAEPLRMYLMGSNVMIGEDMNIDENGIKEQLKSFIIPFWNSYAFFVTYANMHSWKPADNLASNLRNPDPDNKVSYWDHIPFKTVENKLDAWIIARLQLAIRDVRIKMDEYNIPAAVRAFPELLNDLSRWYIRRSRGRFAVGDQQALDTLYYVLVEFAKLIAPVLPFLSEAVYRNLVADKIIDQPESIHLTNYPHPDTGFLDKSSELLEQMQEVREVVNMGQSIRVQKGFKVRQPLAELEIQADQQKTRDWDFENWMKELIIEELNVKKVQEVHELTPKEGWEKQEDTNRDLAIQLDLNLSAELQREGTMRELGRQVQSLRKKHGLAIGDKIKLSIATTSNDILVAIDVLKTELGEAVNADEIAISKSEGKGWEQLTVNNNPVAIHIEKV